MAFGPRASQELYQLRLPLVDLARMGATKLLKELQNFGTLCILIQLYTWMPWLVQDLLFAIFFVSVILGSFFESIIAGNVIYGHFRRQPVRVSRACVHVCVSVSVCLCLFVGRAICLCL